MSLKFPASSSRGCFALAQLYCDGRGVAQGRQEAWLRRTSINVTLKKAVDWVELKPSQSPVPNPSTGAGTAV
jgi:TPR repeat protein